MKRKIVSFLCIFALLASLMPAGLKAFAETENLVVNPSFSQEYHNGYVDGWVADKAGEDKGHFYLDPGGSLYQDITIPKDGKYESSCFMLSSGSGVDAKYGLKYKDGAILKELVIPNGCNQILELGQFNLKENDVVTIYFTASNSSSWINGDDVVLQIPEVPYSGNLLVNPGFEKLKYGWNFVGDSYTQTNNKHSGTYGFGTGGGTGNEIHQKITIPYNGIYKNSVYLSTGGAGSKYGIEYADGTAIKEITIPNGAGYNSPINFGDVELKQGDEVVIYSRCGSNWTNGDDFSFGYDFKNITYNLLTNCDLTNDQSIRLPWAGGYIFTANVEATSETVISADGQSETVPAGTTKKVEIKIPNKELNAIVEIAKTGTASLSDVSLTVDFSSLPNEAPVASNVKVNGTTNVGEVLKATYTFTDSDAGQSEGATKVLWFSSDTIDGTYASINVESSETLTITSDLEGKYIKVKVTPVDSYNLAGTEVESTPVGPVRVNLIENPDMEKLEANSPAGWVATDGARLVQSDTQSHSGFRCGNIPSGSSGSISYRVKIEKYGKYKAAIWAKTNSDSNTFGVRYVGDSGAISSITLPNTGGEYKMFKIDDIIILDNTIVELYVKGSPENKGLYCDDAQLLLLSTEGLPVQARLETFSAEGAFSVEINSKEGVINVIMPYGTDITKVKLDAAVNDGAELSFESGKEYDLTNPFKFKVTSKDQENDWTVYCTVGEKKITIKSDNSLLDQSFNWAVNKTDQFVMTGKTGPIDQYEGHPATSNGPYIPSYWAGYYDRTAFYSRDFVHQASGAQIVGLSDENYSMFNTFAKNCTDARKYYTLWAFNFDGSPHTIDYKNDNLFVREVPAQFELVEKAYDCYIWTADERFISDEMMKYYENVMTQFVDLHDTELDNDVAEGAHGANKGIFYGSATYNERGEYPLEAGDAIASQYAATVAYSKLLAAKGEAELSKMWQDKADALKKYFNEDWSVDPDDPTGNYIYGIQEDGTKLSGFGKETSWFMPMKLITEPGERNDAFLDYIYEQVNGSNRPTNIEALTYIPDVLFPYNRADQAWDMMKQIISVKDNPHEKASQGTNGDYPEVSYTFVSHVVEGMMGVEPDAVNNTVYTISRLPSEVTNAQLDYVSVGNHEISVKHEGGTKTTLSNNDSGELLWQPRFYGTYNFVTVNGRNMPAKAGLLNGLEISYVDVAVKSGEEVTAEAKNIGEINIIEGMNQTVTKGNTARFVSNAEFYDFDSVSIDGTVIDPENYTVTEGSTVVELKAEYITSLSADEHTIAINSTTGKPSTLFTVLNPDNEEKKDSQGDGKYDAGDNTKKKDVANTGDLTDINTSVIFSILSLLGIFCIIKGKERRN